MRERRSRGVEKRGKPEKCDFIFIVGNGPSIINYPRMAHMSPPH